MQLTMIFSSVETLNAAVLRGGVQTPCNAALGPVVLVVSFRLHTEFLLIPAAAGQRSWAVGTLAFDSAFPHHC